MATKKAAGDNNPLGEDTTPDWPTQKKLLYPDGRLVSINNQVWLYRKVPLGPVDSATTTAEAIKVGQPIMRAFTEIESLTRFGLARRSTAKSKYRDFHMLLVNVPDRYVPDPEQPLRHLLSQMWPAKEVRQRVLLFGVRLSPSIKGQNMRTTVDNFVQSWSNDGTLRMEEFKRDFDAVDAALTRAGLTTPTPEEFRLCDSWWNAGRYPDSPYLVHSDHLHMFTANASLRDAARLDRDEIDCTGAEWKRLPDHHTLAMVAFDAFKFDWREAGDPMSNFMSELLKLGSVAVSVRGKIEPTEVTRNQLRSGRKQYLADLQESSASGNMDRADQGEKYAQLEQMEKVYATSGGRMPTAIECSIVAALNGADERGSFSVQSVGQRIALSNMDERQEKALAEMMLGSKHRANPLLHDLPATALAFTGAPNLSVCGDLEGALLGFTEFDKQPVYVSPVAASVNDSLPLMLVGGAVGSGKTQCMQWLAYQFAQMGSPNVIVDPKPSSDLSPVVLAAGGQVTRLDDLTQGDGVLDPLRFTANVEAGLDAAGSMLMQVDPWNGNARSWETDLMVSLRHGVERRGATCIGQALKYAQEDGVAPPEMVKKVLDLAESSAQFRACVGIDPHSDGLRVADGITLIMVGDGHLELPQPGQPATSLQQRIAMALVRMMVFGSAMALTGRRGVLHFDEAWVAMQGGATEVERLGRLARSQEVLPILYTQRVSDAVNNGLAGYISRGLILAIKDEDEAAAACELFKLEPTPERMGRITAGATIAGAADQKGGSPNWNGLRALFEFDPTRPGNRGRNLRGSVGIHFDLAERAVPVVIDLPDWFLKMSTTNTADLRARKEAERLAALSESTPDELDAAALAEQYHEAEQAADDTVTIEDTAEDQFAPDGFGNSPFGFTEADAPPEGADVADELFA